MATRYENIPDRRSFLKTGAAVFGSIAAARYFGGCSPAIRKNIRPNILFIITDQQHRDTIRHLGCGHVETPGMDRIAKQGTSFMEFYTPHPVCLPARASFFTGRMPSETGINTKAHQLLPGLPTLGEWIRDRAEYQTVYAGKWHVPEYIPNAHDDIPGFYTMATGITGQGFLMDTHVAMACEAYIRNYSGTDPFFMVASFMNPHDICEWQFLNTANRDDLWFKELADRLPPLRENMVIPEGEPEAIRGFRNTLDPHVGYWEELQYRYYLWSYYRHIDMVDGEIERLLDALKETGRDRDTLIFLTSDHGEGLGSHLMTHKLFPYDEVCRVPFLASLPGSLPEDSVNAACLGSGVDIMPTLCDFAGVQPPPGMKGLSLRNTLETGTGPDREFVAVEVVGNKGKMIRTKDHKYVRYEGDPNEMLFDIRIDPGETKNLIHDETYAAVIEKHKKLLEEWMGNLEIAEG